MVMIFSLAHGLILLFVFIDISSKWSRTSQSVTVRFTLLCIFDVKYLLVALLKCYFVPCSAVAAPMGGKTWPVPGCKPSVNPCVPSGKPSSFHSVMLHQFFVFHSTIFHTNIRQLFRLMASDGRF